MLIRDLEMNTGLDRATIRFYEKEGLIEPNRKDNGYREYTKEHETLLFKIKLLRQLGMPLETIKDLQNGTADFDDTLKNQIKRLEARIEHATNAKSVCIQIRDDNVAYSTLDAQYYLQLLNQKGMDSSATIYSEDIPRPYHPLRRYFARLFDYGWITILLLTLFSVIIRIRPIPNWLSIVIQYGSLLLAVPILALMLHYCGTTPGKWLFCLSVISENGNKLDYAIARDREWQALVRGYGLGLPVFRTVRLCMSCYFYREGRLNWDDYSETRYHTFGRKHKVLIIAAVIAMTISSLLVAADSLMPKYRGELSLEDFSHNYNYYAKINNEDSLTMLADGQFDDWNTVFVDISGDASNATHEFEFIMQNDNVKTITYGNTWTNIRHVVPISERCEVAVFTAVASQRGVNIIDMLKFGKIWKNADLTTDGKLESNGVVITWDIEHEYCYISEQGIFYPRMDAGEDMPASVSVTLTIDLPVS